MTRYGVENMDCFSLGELLKPRGNSSRLTSFDYQQTALIHDCPSLSSYLIGQVIEGASILKEDKTGLWVDSLAVSAFEQVVRKRGGESFRYKANVGMEASVLHLGPCVISCHGLEPKRNEADASGREVFVWLHTYPDSERAQDFFERVKATH